MIDSDRHVHFCDCEDCMNMGGGVPATSTLVIREAPTFKTPETQRLARREYRRQQRVRAFGVTAVGVEE